jgi:hypothetical protein
MKFILSILGGAEITIFGWTRELNPKYTGIPLSFMVLLNSINFLSI